MYLGRYNFVWNERDYFWWRREDHRKEKKPVECKESRMDESRVWIADGIYGASG